MLKIKLLPTLRIDDELKKLGEKFIAFDHSSRALCPSYQLWLCVRMVCQQKYALCNLECNTMKICMDPACDLLWVLWWVWSNKRHSTNNACPALFDVVTTRLTSCPCDDEPGAGIILIRSCVECTADNHEVRVTPGNVYHHIVQSCWYHQKHRNQKISG